MDTLLNSSVVEEKEPLEIGKCVGRLYDILAQVISVLDVTTDIMICYQFYAHGRIIFFTISLAILILALMSYSVLFVNVFSGESQCSRNLALFMVLLPVSPLIPFVFYYSGYPQKPDACLSIILKKICCFELDFDGPSPSKNASKFKQFFEKKVEQHAGFIIESLIEAFPQAILQMTAIVIYNETNITAIVSILISLLSVASKSFVFSLGAASNFKQLFFTWLCACCDFFGIFFMVSWVFWRPHDADLQDAFATIQQVWLYKLYIFTFPLILIPLSIMYCGFILESIRLYSHETWYKQISHWFLRGLVFTVVFLCAIIACLLALEITGWTWIAVTFLAVGTSRYPTWNKQCLEFWFTILKWIKSAKAHHVDHEALYSECTSYTAKQDKMMRISAANWILNSLMRKRKRDRSLMKYLQKHQRENQYVNVTMSGIRNNATNSLWKCNSNNAFWDWYSMIWRDVYSDRQEKMNQWRQNRTWRNCNDLSTHTIFAVATGLITFVFGPTYLIGRFAHLSFAVFIVLYLYLGYDINIWNTDKIDMFQIVMISIYIILCIVLSVLCYYNAKEQYTMCHLLPSQKRFGERFNNEAYVESTIKKITNHYYGMTFIPIRRAMIIDTFGPDLGQIIASYLPNDDDFDVAGNLVKATVV
eukprot:174456_1